MGKAIKCDYCGDLVGETPYKEIHLKVKGVKPLVVRIKWGVEQGEHFKKGDICDNCLGSLFANLSQRFSMDTDEPTIIRKIWD